MKRKLVLSSVFLILCSAAGWLLFPKILTLLGKDVFYIAIVATEEEKEEVLQGVRLCLQHARASGKLTGKTVRLQFFDDRGEEQRARQIAEQIAQENTALAVIGHIYSSTSLAASPIYKKHGIPAITASATSELITQENEWYFSVIPNNVFQVAFIANYLKSLGQNTATVVYENGSYGVSLVDNFEKTARKLGIHIRKKLEVEMQAPDLEARLDRISAEILALEYPGAIFLALFENEAARIITHIKTPDHPALIIGPDVFEYPEFIEALKKYPEEQASPGYYSDGIYVVSSFMIETASEFAHQFRQDSLNMYHEEPTLTTALNYDAMQVLVEAISRTHLEGPGYIRSDRKKIRTAMTGFYNLDTSIEGVTANIYFDRNGQINRPLAVGVYSQQKILPAFFQYLVMPADQKLTEQLFQRMLDGKIIMVDNTIMMAQTQVVLTGIIVHEVSAFDIKKSTYTLDFSLWFRFREDFDDSNITFTNAVSPIQLGAPVVERFSDSMITRVYRTQGTFQLMRDFYTYPFDTQTLAIAFRHAIHQRNNIMYVPETSKPPAVIEAFHATTLSPDTISGWTFAEPMIFQDVISHKSNLGEPNFFDTDHTIAYSRFNFMLPITRNVSPLLWQLVVPLGVLFILIGAIYVFPSNWFEGRVALVLMVIIVNALLHVRVLSETQASALIAIEYPLFGVYGAGFLAISWSISMEAFYRKRLALVQKIPLFSSFSEKEKVALSKVMSRHSYRKPGIRIIRQGDPGDSFFVVIKGEVAVQVEKEDGQTREIRRMQAGEFFGEMAILTGEPRSAHIFSTTPVILCELTKKHLTPLLRERPDILQIMSNELSQRKLSELQKKDTEHAEDIDKETLSSQYAQQIAEFLGLSHHHLS